MSSWTLAHNLKSRVNSIHAVYPGLTIGTIGDPEHQQERSDHNPDARGIVHAIDPMVAAGTDAAAEILDWLLGEPADLEYVIHNRVIYQRDHGFVGIAYTGSDPHTNHIHASGKHGATGWSSATGTGYDTKAEAMTPAGMTTEVDMNTAQDNALSETWAATAAIRDGKDVQKTDTYAGGPSWLVQQVKTLQEQVKTLLAGPTDEQVADLAQRIAGQIDSVNYDTVVAAVKEGIRGAFITPPQ